MKGSTHKGVLMNTFSDLLKRAFFLCLYIIPVPLGAYTIHNGSSAVVALVSYIVLSLAIPCFYLSSPKSGFGKEEKRVAPFVYVITWALAQGVTYLGTIHLNLSELWAISTIGRDIVFAIVMYFQVAGALAVAYMLSLFIGVGKKDDVPCS